jgi:hypothetical protein
MKTTVHIAAAVALVSVLAGCGTSTKVISSNAQSVSVVFDGDQSTMPDVTKMATAECQKSGRIAVLRDIAQVEDGRIANFDCRTPS